MGWAQRYDPVSGKVTRVWVPRTADEKAALRATRTNKFGGPVGTKKDAAGRSPSERLASQQRQTERAKSGGTATATKTAVDKAGLRQQRKAEAKVLEQQKLNALKQGLAKKAKKHNLRAQKQLDEIAKKREAALAQATEIQRQLNANPTGVQKSVLKAALVVQNVTLLQLEHKEMTANSLVRRAKGFDMLAAYNKVKNATHQATGEALGTDPNPYQMDTPRRSGDYGFGDFVRDGYAVPSSTKPGERGHAKTIRRGLIIDVARASQHPEWFDTAEGAEAVNDGLFVHWEQLKEHKALITDDWNTSQKAQKKVAKGFWAARRKYKKSGDKKHLNQMNAALAKLKKMAADPEYKQLQREVEAIYGVNAVRADFTVKKNAQLGLVWAFQAGMRHVYKQVEDRQRSILSVPQNAMMKRQMEKDIADFRSDLYDVWAKLAPEQFDIGTHSYGKQSFESWLVQVEREGLPPQAEALEDEAFLSSQTSTKRAIETSEDPLFKYLYPRLKEAGIETSEDLEHSAHRTRLDKFAYEAVIKAQEDWLHSDEYDPPTNSGIYDYTRYGEDVRGRYFILDNGEFLYEDDPLPWDRRTGKRAPLPMWESCSTSMNITNPGICDVENSMEAAGVDADDAYGRSNYNELRTKMSKEIGKEVRDPLAFGPGSEFVSSAMAVFTIPLANLRAYTGTKVSAHGDLEYGGVGSALSGTDINELAKEALTEFVDGPDYIDPGIEYGLFEQSNYLVDDDGIYFRFERQDGEVFKVRPGDYLPVPRNPLYNGGRGIQPVWFDPIADGAAQGFAMGMFESQEEYRERLKDIPPTLDSLQISQSQLTARYHNAYRKRAFEEAGGFTDIRDAIAASDEWTLLHHGPATTLPGGAAVAKVRDGQWEALIDTNVAKFNDFLSNFFTGDVTRIQSKVDGRIVEQWTGGVSLPGVDGAIWTAPFGLSYEYGEAVGEELDADIEKANEAFWEGDIKVFLETYNDIGVPIEAGSLAEAMNLMFEMVADWTNWFPFVNAAKRGLQGVRAGVAAGRISNVSKTAKVAAAVSDAMRAVRTHPDKYRAAGALAKDVEAKFGISSDEFTIFLQSKLTGALENGRVTDSTINKIAEYFAKQRPDIDPRQIHRWVEQNVKSMLESKGFTVRTQTDERIEAMERAKAATDEKEAKAVDIEAEVQARQKRYQEDAQKADRAARQHEQERARAEAKKVRERERAATKEGKLQAKVDEAKQKEMERLTKEGREGESFIVKVDKGPAISVRGGWSLQKPQAKPGLLADSVKGDGAVDDTVVGSKAHEQKVRRQQRQEKTAYENRSPELPDVRLQPMPKGQYGPGRAISRADVRQSIEQAVREIEDAERKLLGRPSWDRIKELEESRVEWGTIRGELEAEMRELERVEQAVEEVRVTAAQDVRGVWESQVGEFGPIDVMVKPPDPEFEHFDVDDLIDARVAIVLGDAGYVIPKGMAEFREYQTWVRQSMHEATGEYNKVLDALYPGKLNPNVNIEKNLEIIARNEALIAEELRYAELRLKLGAPDQLWSARVPQHVGEFERMMRTGGLAESLSQTSMLRRQTLAEAARQAEGAPRYSRYPYKLDKKWSDDYTPRAPVGSLDEAKRAREHEMVAEYRAQEGIGSVAKTRSQWRTGERVTFPSLVPAPGSRAIHDPYVQSLDTVIRGPDFEKAAMAYHEKAIILRQEWDRYNAISNGKEYPNGQQSYLSGGFETPDDYGKLVAQNRAYREVHSRSRMQQPVELNYMLTNQTDEVVVGRLRQVTVDEVEAGVEGGKGGRLKTGNDPRGRTAAELAGQENWFYSSDVHGLGAGSESVSSRLRRTSLPRTTGQVDETVSGVKGEAKGVLKTRGGEQVAGDNPYQWFSIGDDMKRAQERSLSSTWYQAWKPWDAIKNDPHLAGPRDSTWRSLNELLQNKAFVKDMTPTELRGVLDSLHAARIDMGWTEYGAFDFRRSMQPVVDLFHRLHDEVLLDEAGLADEAYVAIGKMHDVMVDIVHSGEGEMWDFAATWLMMESRMGMPLALPSDYAMYNFRQMAKSRGMMPQRALLMVQHKLGKPKYLGAHTDLNPSVQSLFDEGTGPRMGHVRVTDKDGRAETWAADAHEPWVATGKTTRQAGGKTYTADWQDSFHAYMDQRMTVGEMVRTSLGLLRTNSAREGDWAIGGVGKLRAAVLERGIHENVVRRVVRGEKRLGFKTKADAQAMGNLYFNDLLQQGKVPPGAIGFDATTRMFELNDKAVKFLKKDFATLDEIRAAVRKAGGDPAKVTAWEFDGWLEGLMKHAQAHTTKGSYHVNMAGRVRNPFGASKLKPGSGTYSNAVGRKGYKDQGLRQAFEMGVNRVGENSKRRSWKPVPAATPFETVFHYVTQRAYWTDPTHRSAGWARSDAFLTDMRRHLAAKQITDADYEVAQALVRDMMAPDLRGLLHQLDGAAGTGASVGYLMRSVVKGDKRWKLYADAGGDPQKFVEQAVASAKARSKEMPESRGRKLFADEWTDEDATALENKVRIEMEKKRKSGDPEEMSDGYADLGEEGGLAGRMQSLEGRWADVVASDGGAKLPEADEVVLRQLADWDRGRPEPKVPERPSPRRVEEVKESKATKLKGAQVGDTLNHKKLGEVEVLKVDGDTITVRTDTGRETRVMANYPVWTRKHKSFKVVDSPDMKHYDAAVAKHDEWAAARKAREEELTKQSGRLRTGRPSEEAEGLVREVIDLILTPGHSGDASLRLGQLARNMVEHIPLADSLKDDLIDAMRVSGLTGDGGSPVWLIDGPLPGKVLPEHQAVSSTIPEAPKRPKTPAERYAGKETGPVREPDEVGPTLEELETEYINEMAEYENAVNARESIINDEYMKAITGENVGTPAKAGKATKPVDTHGKEMAELAAGNTKRHHVARAIFDSKHNVAYSAQKATGTADELVDDIAATVGERPSRDLSNKGVDAEAAKRHGDDFTDEQWHETREAMRDEYKQEIAEWEDEVNAQLMARQAPSGLVEDGLALVEANAAKAPGDVENARQARVYRRAHEIQKEAAEPPLPAESDARQWAESGDEGVHVEADPRDLQADPHVNARTVWDYLGYSEERYYQRLIRANHNEMFSGKSVRSDVPRSVPRVGKVDGLADEMSGKEIDDWNAAYGAEEGPEWVELYHGSADVGGLHSGGFVAEGAMGFDVAQGRKRNAVFLTPDLKYAKGYAAVAKQGGLKGTGVVKVRVRRGTGFTNGHEVNIPFGEVEGNVQVLGVVEETTSVSAARFAELDAHNKNLLAALRHIRRQKAKGTYKRPGQRMKDATEGAEKVRDDIEGIIPEQRMGYYADSEEGFEFEHARALRVRAEKAKRSERVTKGGLPAHVMRPFRPEHWRELTDFVGGRVSAAQAQRTKSLPNPRVRGDDVLDDILRTNRDSKWEIVAAVKEALVEWAEKNGHEAWTPELYWRVRTLVVGSESRMRRGLAFFDITGPEPADFLALRRAATDNEAYETVKWWLYEHPHATPEEAAEHFRLTHGNSGVIEETTETLTEADISILEGMFQHLTGVKNMDDIDEVRAALQKHGKPPMDDRLTMRQHQEKVGKWSPRTAEEVTTKGAWNIDEEAEYWRLNFEEVPRWIDDPRVRDGSAFKDYATHQAFLKETGGYDDRIRLERELKGEHQVDFDTIAEGRKNPDGTWDIKPQKDADVERRYAMERYGDRVHDNGKMTEMPWLMTPDEIIEYHGKHGAVPGIISDPAEVRAVNEAIKEVLSEYVDEFVKMYDPRVSTVISSSDIHKVAFEMQQRLITTTPWRTWKQKGKGLPRDFVRTWGAVWTGLVLMNPAFVLSNAIDTPTKTLLFAISEKYAKKGDVSALAKAEIVGPESLGLGGQSQFIYSRSSRGAMERVTDPLDAQDRVGGAWDLVTKYVADHVLRPIEDTSKTKLGQRLFDGYYDEFAEDFLKGTNKSGANPKLQTLTEEQTILLIKLRVKDRLMNLFPSLENAGLGEKLLNQLLPFISYNFKNKVLWTSWVLDHPWSLKLLGEMQGQIAGFNEEWWNEKFPGLHLPEHLAHQIPMGLTGMFMDVGMFTDMARGASFLTSDRDWTVEDVIRFWIRPLPSQESFAANVLYDVTNTVTGHGWGGRYVWRRYIDPETGLHDPNGGPNGNGYVQDYVGPGTFWGDRRMDYLNDMLPWTGLMDTLKGSVLKGDINEEVVIRIIGNIIDFGEFGQVSETSMLWWQYFQLAEENQAAARHWMLNTPDGQRLMELQGQAYYDPDQPDKPFGNHYSLNNTMSLFYDEEGNFKVPEPNEQRKLWLRMQPPDMANTIREGNEKLFALRDAFDLELDKLDPYDDEARQELWKLRRSSEGAVFQQYPELYSYYAFGKSEEDFYEHRAQSAVDTQRSQYYAQFGYEHRPEDPEEAKAWDERRRRYLVANPDFAKTLASEYSGWQQSLNQTQRARDLAVANNESMERIRTWAQNNDRQGVAKAASTLMERSSIAFSMESAGYDANGKWRFKHDSAWKKLLKGDDPAKVWYADAMQSVGDRAKDQKGEFDVNKWWRIVDRHPELRAEYLEREGMSRAEWADKGALYQFHHDFNKAADADNWDKAWRLYQHLPERVKDYWEQQNPKGFKERRQGFEYNVAMGRWVSYFERNDPKGGMDFFYSLPQWMRDRYYKNNPGKQLSRGQHVGFQRMLDSVFNNIDAGNWDEAERIWRSAPAWMRKQYYASNPDSTMFRGSGSGKGGFSSGGGISDAKFKQYSRAMKTWVELLEDGKEAQADSYFQNLPSWMREFYYQNNPDKKWQADNDRMLGIAADYWMADKAARAAILKRNPGLARWLAENDTESQRAYAIRRAFEKLPEDPWLRRVYKEKYPEVFGDERKGEMAMEKVLETIEEFPFIRDAWMKWYEGIHDSLIEAMKWNVKRPRQLEKEYHEYSTVASRGMSAADTSKWPSKVAARSPVMKGLRDPRIS